MVEKTALALLREKIRRGEFDQVPQQTVLAALQQQQAMGDPKAAMLIQRERMRQQEMNPTGGANALPGYAAANDPAFNYAAPVVSAQPTAMYDPRVKAYQDMVAAGRASPRGRAQATQSALQNARLRAEIDRLRNTAMPAEYGDNARPSTRGAVQEAFLSLLGRGGMR